MNSRYLKIAWRNQWKHKGAFLINVIGLSVALAAVFFISLWVRDELSVDKFHEKDSQLYQVMEVGHANNSVAVLENTQGLLAESFVKDFPEVEKACAFFSLAQANIMVNLKTGGPNVTKSAGAIADKQFFELFSYPLLEGKPSEVMNDKNGVVVSASLAKRLYGDTRKAVGKPVEWSFMDFRATATIAGVFADIPYNSTQRPPADCPLRSVRHRRRLSRARLRGRSSMGPAVRNRRSAGVGRRSALPHESRSRGASRRVDSASRRTL